MTVFDMPSPFAAGAMVVGTSGLANERVGKVTSDRGDGTILVKLWGDGEALSWHWSHFALVDPATGETVHPIVNRPDVPTE